MTFTRDSVIWTVGGVGSFMGMVAVNTAVFPISESTRIWLNAAAFAAAWIAGWLRTSPLPPSPAGRIAEQQKSVETLQQAAADVVASTPTAATVVVDVDPGKPEGKQGS